MSWDGLTVEAFEDRAERRRARKAAARIDWRQGCTECGVPANVVDPPNGCPWHPF